MTDLIQKEFDNQNQLSINRAAAIMHIIKNVEFTRSWTAEYLNLFEKIQYDIKGIDSDFSSHPF